MVVGGGGFSIMPEQFLREIGGELGVKGEGEKQIISIANSIREKGGIEQELRGKVLTASYIEELDQLTPDRDSTLCSYYLDRCRYATIQTKRGCNLACYYCTYPLIEGKRIRMRNPESVVEEMEEIYKRYSINHFTIVDSIFNNPESHAASFCELLIKKKLKLKWTAYFRPEFKASSFFKLLKLSNCSGIDATPDGLTEKTLETLGKRLDIAKIEAFCTEARKHNIPINLNLIIGAPGEDPNTIEETFKMIEKLRPHSVIIGIGIRLYPSAPLTQKLMKEGIIKEGSVGLHPLFYLSEKLSDDIFEQLKNRASKDKRIIIPSLGVRYNPRLFRRMRKHGKKDPIWKYI